MLQATCARLPAPFLPKFRTNMVCLGPSSPHVAAEQSRTYNSESSASSFNLHYLVGCAAQYSCAHFTCSHKASFAVPEDTCHCFTIFTILVLTNRSKRTTMAFKDRLRSIYGPTRLLWVAIWSNPSLPSSLITLIDSLNSALRRFQRSPSQRRSRLTYTSPTNS